MWTQQKILFINIQMTNDTIKKEDNNNNNNNNKHNHE